MKQPLAILLLLLLSGSICAQERIDPRHPDAVEFPEFGRMDGTIDSTRWLGAGIGEQFGFRICPVGDVNHDGLADWLVGHKRIDSLQQFGSIPIPPIEFLLYKGVRGGLPAHGSGVRIGPTELFCETDFLAAGDFDADGNRDIVMKQMIYGDTSFNNHGGKPLSYVMVYWGNDSGTYSNDDTSRLSSAANTWLGSARGVAGDISGDEVDDLVLYFVGGTAQGYGQTVKAPRMSVFIGSTSQRWGRNAVQSTAYYQWWSRTYNVTQPDLRILDHDLDGANDIVLFNQAPNNAATTVTKISILYGRAGRDLPDTLDMEQIDLATANGRTTRLTDVTGDGVPEMVTTCGDETVFKIFAGQKGQRLKAQYGSGKDGPLPGQGWWSRPWQTILQPPALHDGWLSIEQMALADLGDANRDGIDDIWTYSEPFLLCYTTREYPDHWVDGFMRIGYLRAGANLGDIDGSGINTIALHYDPTPRQSPRPKPGGIVFIKQNRYLPTEMASPPVRLPHPESRVQVSDATGERLDLVRARGSGAYILALRDARPGIEYTIQIFDRLGRQVADFHADITNQHLEVHLPPGLYFASLIAGNHRTTRSLIID